MNKETKIEEDLIYKLKDLKYTYRPDIRDYESLEQNFLQKFESLNNVKLTDKEFKRLLKDTIQEDVFKVAKTIT